MANTTGKGNNKGNSIEKKNSQSSITQKPKAPPKDVKLGDGFADTVKDEINKQAIKWARAGLTWFFDYLEAKVKDLPEAIKRLRSNPETERAFAKMWADQLLENNLIPAGYRGLSDKDLIWNLRQDGYMGGMFVGFIATMMGMVDEDVPRDKIIAVRNSVYPSFLGKLYENKEEFSERFDDEKYSWILPSPKRVKGNFTPKVRDNEEYS